MCTELRLGYSSVTEVNNGVGALVIAIREKSLEEKISKVEGERINRERGGIINVYE